MRKLIICNINKLIGQYAMVEGKWYKITHLNTELHPDYWGITMVDVDTATELSIGVSHHYTPADGKLNVAKRYKSGTVTWQGLMDVKDMQSIGSFLSALPIVKWEHP